MLYEGEQAVSNDPPVLRVVFLPQKERSTRSIARQDYQGIGKRLGKGCSVSSFQEGSVGEGTRPGDSPLHTRSE
jgi:hypothetical protein